MPAYHYYNTLNNKVSTATAISFCQTIGPMSMCRAVTIADQAGCRYREDASKADYCLYYRPDLNGVCDNPWAQMGKDKPK